MNWDKIVKLALTLFLTQVVIGFLDGALSPTDAGIKWLVASAAVSFVACGAIFAVFAIRQPTKQFTHAWIGFTPAISFGIWHGLSYSDASFSFDLMSALFPSIGSIAGGWLRFNSGSLLFPILAHSFANIAFHLTALIGA